MTKLSWTLFFAANELSWQNFKHICTDDAPEVIGVKSGLVTLMKNKWPYVTSSHCSLHRYILAFVAKNLPLHLIEVMADAVKVINFICSRAKNHLLFHFLAKEIGTQYVGLLFYTKVRWLPRSKWLFRLYELKNEVEIFLQENKTTLHVQFHNEKFIVMLAYQANVFGHLNVMNLSLQD